MRFEEALAELDGRQPARMVPDLSRISLLAELLADPQLTYPTIHVTGTNGKTTTARLVSALACAHGLTTGLYTSPHLVSVTERLQICGEPVAEEELAEVYGRLLPFLEMVDERSQHRVTYFEVLTALAFLWFSDVPVGLGVFEVGMGGTWDATNLVAGDVAVVCEIGLDHPELGSTIAEVATEKAGILKEGKVAVSRRQQPEALEVLEARARDVGTRFLLEPRDFTLERRSPGLGGQVITVRGLHATYEDLVLPLFGAHAAFNAALAVAALEALFDRPLSEEAVAEGLAAAASPGRLQVAGRHPLVILDGAHNPDGAAALAEALLEGFVWGALDVVLAVSGDKDLGGIVAALSALEPRLVLATRYGGARAADPETVAAACRDAGLGAATFESVAEALDAARERATEGDAILVTGSLYTVADARRALGS